MLKAIFHCRFFQGLHSNYACTEDDRAYIKELVWDMLPRVADSNTETVEIGSMEVPIPPANVGELSTM